MRLFSMIFGYKQLNKDVEAEGVMYTVVPRQIIKWSHAEAGDDCSLPLLWKQLLPYTLLGSQWLLHLMGTEGDYVINQHIFYQVNLRRKKNLSLRTENCCFHEVFFFYQSRCPSPTEPYHPYYSSKNVCIFLVATVALCKRGRESHRDEAIVHKVTSSVLSRKKNRFALIIKKSTVQRH